MHSFILFVYFICVTAFFKWNKQTRIFILLYMYNNFFYKDNECIFNYKNAK